MKEILLLLLVASANFACSQKVDLDNEIDVIKQTLPQYLDENPNSIASYMKGGTAYKLAEFGIEWASEKDSLRKEAGIAREKLDRFSDSITLLLKSSKKITVSVSDTLYAYRYVPSSSSRNLRIAKDWNEYYKEDLLPDFKENKLVRFSAPVEDAEEYIDLLKKQIYNNEKNAPFSPPALNESYYAYEKTVTPGKPTGEFDFKGDKIYRPVFNKDQTKACYLFSAACRTGTCRTFIFVKKEKGKWIFVCDYGSSILDDF